MHLGVLAEDENDCAVLGALCRRMPGAERLGIKRRSANGCGTLRRKAEAWLKALAREGCRGAVILHDLDREPRNGQLNDEARLRAQLEALDLPDGLTRLVCIPVQEIEAWFWSDEDLIQQIGRGKARSHPRPEAIRDPKEALIRLSRQANGKPLYSQNDNAKLAASLNLEVCAERCPAFRQLQSFVLSLVS